MRRAQIIKDSLYDYLSEIGYSYIADKDTWVFRKEDGEVKREIVIHDIYGAAIRFDFASNVGSEEGIPYMDRSKVRFNCLGFCEYQNEEEFKEIIEEIKKVIVTKEDEIFTAINMVSEERSLKEELEKEVFENHVHLIEQGKIFLEIKNETGAKCVQLIINELKKIHGKKIQDVKEELAMLSALYGQVYEEKFEGKWVYDKKQCKIESKVKSMEPLTEVISYWEGNDDKQYKRMILDYQHSISKYNQLK